MFSTRLVSLGVLASIALGWACHGLPKPPPEVLAIEPALVPEAVRTAAIVHGRNFYAEVETQLSSSEPPAVDRTFAVLIDGQPLPAEDVSALSIEALAIVVPDTLLPGPHDVTVVTPGGRSATLAGGLTVEGIPPSTTHLSIEDLPDGGGRVVGPLFLTVDSLPVVAHAVWRDGSGAYLGTRSARWMLNGAGMLTVRGGGTGATFTPTTPGVAQIVAEDPAGLIASAQSGSLWVDAGTATSLVWETIASPQELNAPFAVAAQAVDSRGYPTSVLPGAPSLAVLPLGMPFTCTLGCADGGTMLPFVGGRWTGEVKIHDAGVSCALGASVLSGTSNEFRIHAPVLPASMPPRAVIQVDRAVAYVGETVNFRSDESTNTPSSNLDYSWDFTGIDPRPPPWTPWDANPYTAFAFADAGTVMVRLAARNAEDLISYATHRVVVVPAGTPICVVTRSGLATQDDGATGCADGQYGSDNMLSLNEVIRLANTLPTKQIITFPPQVEGGGGMWMTGNVTYSLNAPVDIVAPYGIYFDGPELVADAGTTLISGLSLTGGMGRIPLRVGPSGSVLLEDAHIYNADGVRTAGDLTVLRTRIGDCNGSCIGFTGPAARLDISFSKLEAAGSATGIDATACAISGALSVRGTTFGWLGTGVKASAACAPTTVLHSTFWNPFLGGVGIQYGGGAGHRLVNNVFVSINTPANCTSTSFAEKDYNVIPPTLSGCSMADPNTLRTDPLLKNPGGDDFRLLFGSPAKNSGALTEFDTNGSAAPGMYEGSAPDRGAWETW